MVNTHHFVEFNQSLLLYRTKGKTGGSLKNMNIELRLKNGRLGQIQPMFIALHVYRTGEDRGNFKEVVKQHDMKKRLKNDSLRGVGRCGCFKCLRHAFTATC